MRTISSSLLIFLAVYASVGHGKSPEQIRGGTTTRDGDFPFVVSLFHNYEFKCGGNIIDARHILTAAHCVVEDHMIFLTNILVRIGSYDLFNGTDNQILGVEIVHLHDGWTLDDPWAHDLAILTLNSSIRFSQHVQPVALPDPLMDIPHDAFVAVVGWGPSTPYESPRFQRQVKMKLIDIESCIFMWTRDIVRHHCQICAVGDENKSVSYGDSGSPLLYNNQLIGVSSSSGIEAPIITFPDIFSRVDCYLSWIRMIIRKY